MIVHPFNLVLLFIISTGSITVKAGVSTNHSETIITFLIINAFGIGIYFAFKKVLKDRIKSSLSLTATLFFTLFFRDIYELLAYTEFLNTIKELLIPFSEVIISLLLVFLVLALIIFWLYKTKLKLLKLNSYLNLLTTIFLLISIVNLVFIDVNRVELKNKIDLQSTSSEIKNKPDIYFIILDGYTGFCGLKKYWNFNNNELMNYLRSNGFFVAEGGRTIYNVTNYALASTLNLVELNFDKNNLYEKSYYLALADIIYRNIVTDYFYKTGYELVNLSFYDIRHKKKFYEDIYFLKNGNIYQSRTIFGTFYEIYYNIINDMSDINLSIFEKLKTIPGGNDSPKFTYAHIMMPHPPYYFDAEGNKNDFRIASDKKNENAYLEQLKYTNFLLMETLRIILNSSKYPPLIVVQGDHGFREFEEHEKKDVEFSVLSCFYFPDKDYSLLTDSTKTINTFRIILDKYFNHSLNLIN